MTSELRRHLRDRTSAVRLPRSLQEASGQVLQAVEELEQLLCGGSPTAAQIADHTGLEHGRVVSTLRAVHECRPRSLDEPTGHDQDSPLACLLGADDDALGRVVDALALASLVKQLPERDRRVLYLRFYREQTQQQIADAIGVSQMRVSRILRHCLDRLREALLSTQPLPGDDEEEQRPRTRRAARPTLSSGGPRHLAGAVRPAGPVRPARPTPGRTGGSVGSFLRVAADPVCGASRRAARALARDLPGIRRCDGLRVGDVHGQRCRTAKRA